MIIIFHSLYFLFKYLVKVYRTAEAIKRCQAYKLIEGVNVHTNCIVTDSLDLRFDPPLYKQRYATVQQILLNVNWKSQIRKVVDFGCSEFNFFPYLKHLFDVNEIVCVDIDEDTLNDYLFKVCPLTVDYLKKRPDHLKVQILLGNVSQPDTRLLGTDAVIAIELIEHLYPDTLEALPYNVFHYIKPLLAIFTTPNCEFNVLFPDAKTFRHIDHKFEWTREQFQSWALNITSRFPNYTVQFDGIGPGPKGMESVGCCTQIAIFMRHSEEAEQLSEVPRSCREISKQSESYVENHNASYGICSYYSYVKQLEGFSDTRTCDMRYKEIESIDYPFHVDSRTPQERMLHEIQYKIFSSARVSSRFYNEGKNRIEYPLCELVSNEEGCFTTVCELRKLLEIENFTVEECIPYGTEKEALCVVYNLSMESNSSTPSSDGNNSDEKNGYLWDVADESDWDADYNQSNKINDDKVEKESKKGKKNAENQRNDNENDAKVTLQIHGSIATESNPVSNKEEIKRDRGSVKKQTNSQSKLPSTSNASTVEKTPKKGTNTKNRDIHSPQSTSKENDTKKRKIDNNMNDNNKDITEKKTFKKNIELKIHDSNHSQASNIPRSTRNNKNVILNNGKSPTKGKLITTSSLKRFPICQSDDSSSPGTSESKKKKKGKKFDEDKEDMKNLTECIIYNTLNNIPEAEEILVEASGSQVPTFIKLDSESTENVVGISEDVNLNVALDILNSILQESMNASARGTEERRTKELTKECTVQELNHASREVLFDPNSETDMLEEFEIPCPPPPPPVMAVPASDHHNVILVGLNTSNEEESVVLPDSADPFPNWLLQLLGANVEDGESHDEPHFYCQGDGIGVHPSIIEVEIDEEESTSDSSSSHHEAEAGYTSSDSGVVQLPTDDSEERNSSFDIPTPEQSLSLPLSRMTTGNSSAADSADEFFDSLEDTLTITNRANPEVNRRN